MSKIKETSIVCAIRNRNAILAKSLPAWLEFDVAEIVLVDFRDDGCQRIWDVIKDIPDPRIKVIETKYEYRWVHGISYNLAVNEASSPYILNLDVDYILKKDFFDNPNHIVSETAFLGRRIHRNTGGLFYYHKNMWNNVNGYDENMMYWGHNDTDFRLRLLSSGYNENQWDLDCVEHIPHKHELSVCNQITGKIVVESIDIKRKGYVFNNYISKVAPWTTKSPRVQWDILKLEDRCHLAIRKFDQPLTE